MRHAIVCFVQSGRLEFAICACGATFRFDPDAHDPVLALEMDMTRHTRRTE